MGKKTVYCVLAFQGRPGRLERSALHQFGERDGALRDAEAMKGRAAGCVVLRYCGDPVTDCWEEPEEVARFGLVPDLAA